LDQADILAHPRSGIGNRVRSGTPSISMAGALERTGDLVGT
jgi:hypothetical protein